MNATWIFDSIISWGISAAVSLLSFISSAIIGDFGNSLTLFENTFPFVKIAFPYIQAFSIALLFVIFMFQNLKNLLGPISDAEHPLSLLLRTCIFLFLTLFTNQIFTMALTMANVPYNWLLKAGTNMSSSFDWLSFSSEIQKKCPGSSLLALIIIVCLGYNFLKITIEIVQRYIVLGVLSYTAPLAFSTGGSKATSDIFKKWCRMVASQMILMILNVWTINIVISGLMSLGSSKVNLFEWTLLMFGFEKVAQHLDSYLKELGMSTAQTGGSLLEEMAVVGSALAASGKAISAGLAGGSFTQDMKKNGLASAMSNFVGNLKTSNLAGNTASGNDKGVGGIVGLAAGAMAKQRFMNGINSTDKNSANAKMATQSISKIAHGQLGKNASIQDNLSSPGKGQSSIGSKSASHYLGLDGANTSVGVDRYGGVTSGQVANGRISGQFSDGTRFDAVSARSHDKPAYDHHTLTAADGSQWYYRAINQSNQNQNNKK